MRTYLRDLRMKKGMSQQAVAERLLITRQYYQQIENGDRQKNISLPLLLSLSEAFEVPIDYLIGAEAKLRKGA